MSAIWLPTSRGVVDSRVWRLNEAAREYDERLSVGRDERIGAWSVFIAVGPMEPPHPVLFLGYEGEELLSPDDLKRRLYEADTARHGTAILDALNKHNEQLKAEGRSRADDATGIAAEAMAWGHRQVSTNPHKAVKLVLGDKAEHRHRRSWGT